MTCRGTCAWRRTKRLSSRGTGSRQGSWWGLLRMMIGSTIDLSTTHVSCNASHRRGRACAPARVSSLRSCKANQRAADAERSEALRSPLLNLSLAAGVLLLPASSTRADALAKLTPEKLEAVHKSVQALKANWQPVPR